MSAIAAVVVLRRRRCVEPVQVTGTDMFKYECVGKNMVSPVRDIQARARVGLAVAHIRERQLQKLTHKAELYVERVQCIGMWLHRSFFARTYCLMDYYYTLPLCMGILYQCEFTTVFAPSRDYTGTQNRLKVKGK